MTEELLPKTIWIIWGVTGAGYAAVCIWLGVRLFNRRERWAKWTAMALAIMPALYVFSSGPMSMIACHSFVTHTPTVLPDGTTRMTATSETGFAPWFPMAYAPLFWASDYPWGDCVFTYWMLFPHDSTFVEP